VRVDFDPGAVFPRYVVEKGKPLATVVK